MKSSWKTCSSWVLVPHWAQSDKRQKKRIKQVSMSINQKSWGFQTLGVCPPLTWGGWETHRGAANLVRNDVQLYDAPRSGGGLLADYVEHLAHQFLKRDTNEGYMYWLSIVEDEKYYPPPPLKKRPLYWTQINFYRGTNNCVLICI